MALAQRHRPLWRQITDHYKKQILSGELRPGDRLPPVRAIAAEWGVSQGVAQQAVAHLNLAEKLVRTGAGGTYVEDARAVPGRQRAMRLVPGEAAEVLSAQMTAAPEYLAALFGLGPGGELVRRESLSRDPGGNPYMLAVDWYPRYLVREVPELLALAPLPGPGGAELIAERAGVAVDGGGAAVEARGVRDDGREAALLGLAPGSACLAAVYVWRAGGEVTEYQEMTVAPGRVLEFALEV